MRVASLASSTEWSLRIKPVYIKKVSRSGGARLSAVPILSTLQHHPDKLSTAEARAAGTKVMQVVTAVWAHLARGGWLG